jgi:GxxExxY protein
MKTYQHQIENAAYDVFRSLGRGQDKIAYQNAFMHSLQEKGVSIMNDKTYPVFYESFEVNDFKPDFCINQQVVIQIMNNDILKTEEELKFTNHLTKLHLEVGYIINFGMKIQVRIKYRSDRVFTLN